MRRQFLLTLLAATCLVAAPTVSALAQDTVKIGVITDRVGNAAYYAGLIETGINLAVKEVNAAGGLLGKTIESTYVDTQTNPGVARAAIQKALDDVSVSSSCRRHQGCAAIGTRFLE